MVWADGRRYDGEWLENRCNGRGLTLAGPAPHPSNSLTCWPFETLPGWWNMPVLGGAGAAPSLHCLPAGRASVRGLVWVH